MSTEAFLPSRRRIVRRVAPPATTIASGGSAASGETGAPALSPGRARVNELMAWMAAGDGAAAIALAGEFRAPMARLVRRHLGRQGCAEPRTEDVDALVIDLAIELFDCCGGWDPAGALPWTWAEHRLTHLVLRHLGQHADPLDGADALGSREDPGWVPVAAGGAGSDDPVLLDVLEDALRDGRPVPPVLAVLHEALGAVGSRRDRAILLEYEALRQGGAPAPAPLVGELFGLKPDAVRQVVHRMRARLRELATTDDRFGALVEVALVA